MDDIFVPVPGAEATVVHCRLPGLATLVLHGWLPMPLLAAVVEAYAEDVANEPHWVIDAEAEDPDRQSEAFLNRWVTAVMVAPAAVLTREEIRDDVVCVEELSDEIKLAIFRATFPALVREVHGGRPLADLTDLMATDERALLVDRIAHRYHLRPSMLLGVTATAAALDLDAALALRAHLELARQLRAERYKHRFGGGA